MENVGDYQVGQHSEKIVEVCLSQRDEQVEAAITAQFQLLAQQKQFKVPKSIFPIIIGIPVENSNVFSVYERMNDNDRSKKTC